MTEALLQLIERIKDALETEEDGDAPVEVARNAHKAEQELAEYYAARCKLFKITIDTSN